MFFPARVIAGSDGVTAPQGHALQAHLGPELEAPDEPLGLADPYDEVDQQCDKEN
jgi:hypothetical protein